MGNNLGKNRYQVPIKFCSNWNYKKTLLGQVGNAHPNAHYPEDLLWPYPYFARRVVVYRVPQNRLMKMMKCQKPHPSLLIWLDNSITEIFSSAILMTGLRLALLPSIPLTYFRFNSNFRTASWWWVLKWTFG